jgi:hypothetical protein
MAIEMMNDTELSDALFDGLVNRVHTERLNDPAWEDPTTDLSHAFSVKRKGHELSFRKGDGRPLLRGEMRWRTTEDNDRAEQFSVWRSIKPNQLLLKLQVEVGSTLDNVVENIVSTFASNSNSN